MFNYYEKEKVFSFQKDEGEELRFSIAERKKRPFVDIRVFRVEQDGSKIATHKGIFLDAEKLSDFKEGVDRLINSIGTRKD